MKPSDSPPHSDNAPENPTPPPRGAESSLAKFDGADVEKHKGENCDVEKRDSEERNEEIAEREEQMAERGGEKLSKPKKAAHKPKKTRRKSQLPAAYSRFDWGNFLRNRRLEMTALIIALLVSNFFVLHVWNFETRFDIARKTPKFLPLWEQLESVEYSLYDARFTNRGPRIPNCLNDIAIVGLDQASLTAFRTWPIPRSWHADLIRRLKKAGAKVIVFDMDFGDRQNLREDAALAKAMADAGNVILPSYDETQSDNVLNSNVRRDMHFFNSPLTTTDYDGWWFLAPEEVKSDPKMQNAYKQFQDLGIDEQTPDLALATLYKDVDKASRRYTFRAEYNDGLVHVGGLAVLAAALFEKNLIDGRKNEAYELALKSGVFPTLNDKMQVVPLHYNAPGYADAPVPYTTPIYFWGPSQTFTTYSYKDVLGLKIANDGKPLVTGYNAAEMKKLFKDKLVFIGSTAHLLKDRFPAPFFKTVIGSRYMHSTQEIDGVEIHASVAAMLLDGEYIGTVKPQTTMSLVYFLSVAAGLWTVILRGWVNGLSRVTQARVSKLGLRISLHAVIWFTLYALFLVPPLFGFWEACQWLFQVQNLWVIVVYPLGSAVVSSVMVLMMLYGAESVERRKTIAQLGAYVAPEVRDEILAQREGDYVRPRRVEATMLFTDLEGFTSYSETHEPEDVVEALNDYFDRMVRIVRAHGGGPDKFIGDAVMAFFGVPVPRYDHASQAVLCAIAMQEECARFRADTGIEFYMRIGIHSGELIAGSIGATKAGFLNYTTIGDTVNLASRLEGKNKEFGSWIMCSATTFEAARELVEGDSASTHIKGKAQDVEVYIVHGLKGHREQSAHWGHQLEGAPNAALTDKQKEAAAFGERLENRALLAPAEEVSEGKSL